MRDFARNAAVRDDHHDPSTDAVGRAAFGPPAGGAIIRADRLLVEQLLLGEENESRQPTSAIELSRDVVIPDPECARGLPCSRPRASLVL